MNFVDDIRHLDGIKANFSISEAEYLASTTTALSPAPHIIYSNVKDIVKHRSKSLKVFGTRQFQLNRKLEKLKKG